MRRLPPFLRPYWRRSYAQEGEDLVLNALFGYTYRGVYVDIGAHDPFAWSNTKKLAEQGWWGLDIDPMPGTAAKFRKYRPRDICLEVAIDIGGGGPSAPFWIFDDEPRWNCLAPSEPVNERDGRVFRPTRRIEVPVITIAEALERAALPRVDLVNLDIEGGEEYILRNWPWDRWKPTVICVEVIGKPAVENATTPLTQFLAQHGLIFASQLISSVIYIERGFLERRYPKPHVVVENGEGTTCYGRPS